MKLSAAIILVIVLSLSLVSGRGDGLRFSRRTVKGVVLLHPPTWHWRVYRDEYYEFVRPHYPSPEYAPAFFALDRVHNRWLQLTEFSTENARLGRSLLTPPGWDFQTVANVEYANLPMRTTGEMKDSVISPDRIRFDSKTGLYEMTFNTQRNMPINVTTFWVRKSDLDEIE